MRIEKDMVFQNIKDKVNLLKAQIEENGVERGEIGNIGDDINDLDLMKLRGFIGCPTDAVVEVIEIADYVSPANGWTWCGERCLRDVIEPYLREVDVWNDVVKKAYEAGV